MTVLNIILISKLYCCVTEYITANIVKITKILPGNQMNPVCIGMETIQEFRAVAEAVKDVGTSWLWLGGIFNCTSSMYYWIGSGVDADIAAMYEEYPPTYDPYYHLVLRRPHPNINAYRSRIIFKALCEEY